MRPKTRARENRLGSGLPLQGFEVPFGCRRAQLGPDLSGTMQGMRPMQDDAGIRHTQMWPAAQVPTADENAHAQPRGKPGERVVTFRDPEGLGSVRKAFGGKIPSR